MERIFSRSLFLIIVSCNGVIASEVNTRNWHLPNEYPATSIPGKAVNKFASELETISGGTMRITVHHGSALGFRTIDHFDAVMEGAVEIASSSTSLWGGIHPIFQVSSLPFLTESPANAWQLYQAAIDQYERILEDNNQKLLFATPWPPPGIWSKRPLHNLNDLRNLKVRTYDTFGTRMMRELNASPIQLTWIDIIPQIATGGLDAVLTSAEGGTSAGFEQYLPFFLELNYASPLQLVHMNREVYGSLSSAERAWIERASRSTEELGFELIQDAVAKNYGQMKSRGADIILITEPRFFGQLREASGRIICDWLDKTEEPGKGILQSYIERSDVSAQLSLTSCQRWKGGNSGSRRATRR